MMMRLSSLSLTAGGERRDSKSERRAGEKHGALPHPPFCRPHKKKGSLQIAPAHPHDLAYNKTKILE